MLNDAIALRRGVSVSCGRTVLAKRVATRPKGSRDELSVRVERSLRELVGDCPFRLCERCYHGLVGFCNINLPREVE